MEPKPLSQLLKEATKTNHQQLEQLVIPRIKKIMNFEDYGVLLQLFYTYFGGLELLVDAHINVPELPDYAQRRKISSLQQDLESIHVPLLPFAAGSALPVITNHLQAMGALYVMEGSTLGGAVISTMLTARLQLEDGKSLRFFASYGKENMAMWQVFTAALNRMTLQPADETVLLNAANQTFEKFSQWIASQPVFT